MNIDGFAFKPDCETLSHDNVLRYNEIKADPQITYSATKSPCYGKTEFKGTLDTPKAQKLSERDILLLMDKGNLCFGGYCVKKGNKFEGAYYTD